MMYPWLRKRVDASLAMIEAFRKEHRPYVSCSFGKDSMVMLWLVRQIDPDVPVIWFDGGKFDEHPETAAFVERVRADWSLNLTTVYPEIPLLEQWRRFGIPDERGDKREREYTKQFIGAFVREAEKQGFDGHFLGMRAAESRYRRFVFSARGPIYFVEFEKIWRCNPLWNWPTKSVWDLIDSESLPVHPIYSQTAFQKREDLRLGVLAESCFHRHGSLRHFRHYYPGLWNELCAEVPAIAASGS